MIRTREEVEEQFEKYKKMIEEGYLVKEIAAAFNTNESNVYNTFTMMGYKIKKPAEENLVYADNSVKLEKVVIGGKRYTDITPIFSPR